MTPDSGILNSILKEFLDTFSLGMNSVKSDAVSLLGVLAGLELILVSLWWAYSGQEALGRFIKKVLGMTFFIWLIDNYEFLIRVLTEGFVYTASRASNAPLNSLDNPSGIIDLGLEVIKPIVLHASGIGIFSGGLIDFFFLFFTCMAILISYAILAIQIFILRIEFGIITTLGLILVPFGVFSHTAFLAEKVLGAIMSFGVKLMTLGFIAGIGVPLISQYQLPNDPTWPPIIYLLVASAGITMLSVHAPGVASALLLGSPSLHAGSSLVGASLPAAGSLAMGGVALAGVRGAVGGFSYAYSKLKGKDSSTGNSSYTSQADRESLSKSSDSSKSQSGQKSSFKSDVVNGIKKATKFGKDKSFEKAREYSASGKNDLQNPTSPNGQFSFLINKSSNED